MEKRKKTTKKLDPIQEQVRQAVEAMDAKKAEDIVVLDVSGSSTLTDYYVIASGNSTPHLKALADELQQLFKKQGMLCHRRSGVADSGWLVIDYVDFVVHIFSQDMRVYYSFEDLWSDAKRLTL